MKIYLKLICLFVGIGMMQSCVHDKCEREVTFVRATPVWLAPSDYRTFEVEASRALKNPGKIYFYNDYIFINERQEGVHVVDNKDPNNPINLAFYAIRGNVDMAVRNDVLYVDSYTDLVTIDISNPTAAKFLDRCEDVFPSFGVQENGNILVEYLYDEVTENMTCEDQGDLFWLEDVAFDSDFSAEVLTNNSTGGRGSSVGTGGSLARFTMYADHLYTVDNSNLNVFDLTGSKPENVNVINLGWGIETIFPYGDKLFIGSNNGMFIYDNRVPSSPSFLSEFRHATSCDPVYVKDNYAYVTLRSGTLCDGSTLNQLDVIDVTDLTRPKLEASFDMDNPHGLSIRGDNLFLCEGEFGLKVFDISDPLKLDKNQLDRIKGIHAYDAISLPTHTDVLLVIGDDGFYQYDTSNPKKLKEISRIGVDK